MARVAVLDDWQGVARDSADWTRLAERVELVFFPDAFASEDEAAERLRGFEVILPMRERTPFPASLIRRLPDLRLIALTGGRAATLDMAACTAQGVLVCNTGGERSSVATAELAFALLLAASRHLAAADAAVRAGRFQGGVPVGEALHGRTLGLLGLGRIGAMVGRYATAFGMRVIAWSPNLTADRARENGAEYAAKDALLAEADAVSIHLVLAASTRGIVGDAELDRMKPGAILVNTSRGPLVDEAALLRALGSGRLVAGLDVFDREPLPPDHPLLRAPNTVLTPHLGYGVASVFHQFYGQSIDNILHFLDGAPVRVLNPEARPA
jgi:phosphoglycerate dehydrogenase-like enzyme